MNLIESMRTEISYRLLLRVLSDPEMGREKLTRQLKRYGYNVEPDDFLGARLMTGPTDRRYLRNRYGITFYPSTVYIPDDVWLPSKYGGRGLLERLTEGKLPDMPEGYPGAWSSYLRGKSLALIKLSVATTSGKKLFHEDFHERFYLTRGYNLTLEEKVIGELHSFHSNLDEGIDQPEVIKEYLCVNFPQFDSQIASIIDLLPHLEETIGDRKLEQLLLNAPSLDCILREAKS